LIQQLHKVCRLFTLRSQLQTCLTQLTTTT